MIKSIIRAVFKIVGPWYINIKQSCYVNNGKLLSLCLRPAFAQCGNNFRVYGYPIIQDPEKIYVGDNFTVNSGAQICPQGKVYIGNNVTMSRGSQITSGGLDTSEWRIKRLKEPISHIQEDVHIADGTWLCVNSIVLSGVKITGKGVIVAAGAVVTHSISEDYVVVAWIPARIVKYL